MERAFGEGWLLLLAVAVSWCSNQRGDPGNAPVAKVTIVGGLALIVGGVLVLRGRDARKGD